MGSITLGSAFRFGLVTDREDFGCVKESFSAFLSIGLSLAGLGWGASASVLWNRALE